ncbi:hypothetical protein [Acidovorax sp. MR-S7]|uniref:hypothetical protein n=1 Tax=Acidovorax sp. MR-S7 TaxID=1268622 RepID=UPI001F285C79|nr:hypothetical protein [Acidovorax sp. MR-S7]
MVPNTLPPPRSISSSTSSAAPGGGGSISTHWCARSRQASKRSAGSTSWVCRRSSTQGGGKEGGMGRDCIFSLLGLQRLSIQRKQLSKP